MARPRSRRTQREALGLPLCFTPVRSPESNGIAEAFVKTFKRDYARAVDLAGCRVGHRSAAGMVRGLQ